MRSRPLALAVCAALTLAGCAPEPEVTAPPPAASTAAKPDYPGQGTVLDPQFKALHDAKQLGKQLNEDVGRNIDAQIDPDGDPAPPQ